MVFVYAVTGRMHFDIRATVQIDEGCGANKHPQSLVIRGRVKGSWRRAWYEGSGQKNGSP